MNGNDQTDLYQYHGACSLSNEGDIRELAPETWLSPLLGHEGYHASKGQSGVVVEHTIPANLQKSEALSITVGQRKSWQNVWPCGVKIRLHAGYLSGCTAQQFSLPCQHSRTVPVYSEHCLQYACPPIHPHARTHAHTTQ